MADFDDKNAENLSNLGSVASLNYNQNLVSLNIAGPGNQISHICGFTLKTNMRTAKPLWEFSQGIQVFEALVKMELCHGTCLAI